jgi:hypothetical protein
LSQSEDRHLDPLRSPAWCARDLNMDRATWYRRVRPVIEVVQVSPRRVGVRDSVHERYKRERTRPAARNGGGPEQ